MNLLHKRNSFIFLFAMSIGSEQVDFSIFVILNSYLLKLIELELELEYKSI